MKQTPSRATVEELYLHHDCMAKAPWLFIPNEFDMVEIDIMRVDGVFNGAPEL
jgi:hypothetical protein